MTFKSLQNIQSLLKVNEGFLVFDVKLVSKLTNLDSSNIFLLITKKRFVILTDKRYMHLKKQWEYEFIISTDLFEDLKNQSAKIKTLYLDLNSVKYNFANEISKFINIKNTPDTINEVFQEKNANEINNLKHAIKITEKSLEMGLKLLNGDITEKQLQKALILNAYELNCTGLSFEPIVAFGENSANIHHSATDKKLGNSKILLIDLGFQFNNQCADMTRTFILDHNQIQIIDAYKSVLKAKYESQKLYQSNTNINESAKLANAILKKRNLPEIPHSLGHGVGSKVHENPVVHEKSKQKFKENTTVTIEPGVYIENNFGIRIEDIIHIRKNDNVNLNSFTLDYKLNL